MLKRNMSGFFVEFFVAQCSKFLQGNHSVLCFGKFPEAKKFVDEKGGVSKVSVKTFCLAVPKKSQITL